LFAERFLSAVPALPAPAIRLPTARLNDRGGQQMVFLGFMIEKIFEPKHLLAARPSSGRINNYFKPRGVALL
jgi:hypothetical protein